MLNKFPVFAKPENYYLVDKKHSILDCNTMLMFIDGTTAIKICALSNGHLEIFNSKVNLYTEIAEEYEGEETLYTKVFTIIDPNNRRDYIDVELDLNNLHRLYKNMITTYQALKKLGIDLNDEYEFKEYD